MMIKMSFDDDVTVRGLVTVVPDDGTDPMLQPRRTISLAPVAFQTGVARAITLPEGAVEIIFNAKLA